MWRAEQKHDTGWGRAPSFCSKGPRGWRQRWMQRCWGLNLSFFFPVLCPVSFSIMDSRPSSPDASLIFTEEVTQSHSPCRWLPPMWPPLQWDIQVCHAVHTPTHPQRAGQGPSQTLQLPLDSCFCSSSPWGGPSLLITSQWFCFSHPLSP